ncbi:NAD(P)H-dependent oxidoreductase [Algoriphagus mannitolivorans]|uniref:NAD(P)H-dependent oxidoreductase n=1 Tax=Algoriphagus mannitolivorans TaxID=226504 RepID=UPI000412BEAE|nr:NAD(P)H-dependent oxidoreductase [Algoriphagus mannitolivorans]
MRKILVLFAHPKYELSDVNQFLLENIRGLENVTIRDLYELYPDFHINIQAEQELLFEHEVIIWHHPIYWYSCPPILKQWIDLVLEFGWAYGPGGVFLRNKYILNAVTSGGSEMVYSTEGKNRYTLGEFLRPFEQTAYLCDMRYLPYFHVGGTHRISKEDLDQKAKEYRELVLTLRDSLEIPFSFIQKPQP